VKTLIVGIMAVSMNPLSMLIARWRGTWELGSWINVLLMHYADYLLVGVAVTCQCGPADNLALFAALATAQPGDILVAATDGFTATSVTGDLLVGMAKNRGIRGLVTDGLVRDVAGILAVGLPVYCAGITANSPVRNGPGTVGLPVVLGGATVSSGDLLIR
jgi:4-hydroxy-4-methyl-2-oxoglutarate aldolase